MYLVGMAGIGCVSCCHRSCMFCYYCFC